MQIANSATDTHQESSSTMVAFSFVTELTQELNKGAIELPSFPDIAMKVKKVLEDENSTTDTISRVVSTEPGLATRILKMANSAANARSAQAILDVKRAVSRLGHDSIRALAVSFAMQDMMDKRSVEALKSHLNDLWNHSVHVAAISQCLAKNVDNVDPDEAMFVGLIHGVGKLYILTKIESFPALFSDDEAIGNLLRDWHVGIGQSIVENWEFTETVVEAVGQQDEVESRQGPVGLGDVLCAAALLCRSLDDRSITEMDFSECVPFKRVGLTEHTYNDLMSESKDEINAMMSALNG